MLVMLIYQEKCPHMLDTFRTTHVNMGETCAQHRLIKIHICITCIFHNLCLTNVKYMYMLNMCVKFICKTYDLLNSC